MWWSRKRRQDNYELNFYKHESDEAPILTIRSTLLYQHLKHQGELYALGHHQWNVESDDHICRYYPIPEAQDIEYHVAFTYNA